MRFHRFALATLAAASLSGGLGQTATAQDISAARAARAPVAAAYNWTGFYVGINGGGGWGRSRYDFVVAGTTTGNFNTSGGLIGGTLGYNWQTGAMVLGIEGDLDWTNIKGSSPCPNPAFTCETSNKWLGTARGRIGYAMSGIMPYVTGGAAFGNIKANIPTYGSADKTKAGWTIGGGVEFAIAGNWTAKAEYLYANLGSMDCGVGCSPSPPVNVDLRANIVRVGINYRFGR